MPISISCRIANRFGFSLNLRDPSHSSSGGSRPAISKPQFSSQSNLKAHSPNATSPTQPAAARAALPRRCRPPARPGRQQWQGH